MARCRWCTWPHARVSSQGVLKAQRGPRLLLWDEEGWVRLGTRDRGGSVCGSPERDRQWGGPRKCGGQRPEELAGCLAKELTLCPLENADLFMWLISTPRAPTRNQASVRSGGSWKGCGQRWRVRLLWQKAFCHWCRGGGQGQPPRQEDELGTRAGGKVRAEGRALGAGHERGTNKTLHQASLLRGEPSDAPMSPSFLQVSPSLPDPWTEKHFPDDLSRLPFIG